MENFFSLYNHHSHNNPFFVCFFMFAFLYAFFSLLWRNILSVSVF